jgi:hypothetical protein
MRTSIPRLPISIGGALALVGVAVVMVVAAPSASALDCSAPNAYPGDAAPKQQLAGWMARGAIERGVPGELPVMGALVESGLQNLNTPGSDSAGFFQMRIGIWNQGDYAGFPDYPELQLKWFLDQAIKVRAGKLAAGDSSYGADPSRYGEWDADVLRPAEQYRGLYQLRLVEAQGLIGPPCATDPGGGGPAPTAPVASAPQCDGLDATKIGTPEADTLRATAGPDVVVGMGGDDTVRGLAGEDVVCGGSGADRLAGGSAADALFGGPGRDRLVGGGGRDRLVGGPGRDSVDQ